MIACDEEDNMRSGLLSFRRVTGIEEKRRVAIKRKKGRRDQNQSRSNGFHSMSGDRNVASQDQQSTELPLPRATQSVVLFPLAD
jgi:hypothetical protein